MNLYVVSILLTILANASYHICQKSIAPGANPLLSMAATYTTALAATLIALPVFGGDSVSVEGFRALNWASFALGLAIFLFEISFLLTYRSGWNLSIAGLYSNVAAGILLVPIGLLCFKETLTPRNVLGIVLALAGIYLMSRD